jgi:hypothetical protein
MANHSNHGRDVELIDSSFPCRLSIYVPSGVSASHRATASYRKPLRTIVLPVLGNQAPPVRQSPVL